MSSKTRHLATAAVTSLVLGLTGCAAKPEPAPEAPVRVALPDLGVALASIPEPFELAGDGPGFAELQSPGGTIRMTATDSDPRLNLVAMVEERKLAFEESENGSWFGRQELGTVYGPAFTARGAYTGESGPVEELWVYALHPDGDRALVMQYAYTPGEGGERAQELLEVLGEVEAL